LLWRARSRSAASAWPSASSSSRDRQDRTCLHSWSTNKDGLRANGPKRAVPDVTEACLPSAKMTRNCEPPHTYQEVAGI
jgi:hypothetical protein